MQASESGWRVCAPLLSRTRPQGAWRGRTAFHTALHLQPAAGPSSTPAAFHLPNYQAEVAVQFALFLYVR